MLSPHTRPASLAVTRSRPPCPPSLPCHKINRATWSRDKKIYAWRASFETYEEYVCRRKQEVKRLRKRPRRQRRSYDLTLSLQKYARRLADAADAEFATFRAPNVVLSVYGPHVPHAITKDPESKPDLFPPSVMVLWNQLRRRGILPIGIVPHTARWVPNARDPNRKKQFLVSAPPGVCRVFIGNALKIQNVVPHSLSFAPCDYVYGEREVVQSQQNVDQDAYLTD